MYQFQFIVVGIQGVGKSSILQRYCSTGSPFNEEMQGTIGIDFHTKIIEIDKHNFKLQLWDTAGQERFRAVVRPYFRNAVGAILIFDISNQASFNILPQLLDEVLDNSKPKLPYFLLVGNKSDKQTERVVSTSDAMRFASVYNLKYIETSAKLGKNIEEVFIQLTRTVYEAIQDGTIIVDDDWRGIKKGNEFLPDKRCPNNPNAFLKITDVNQKNSSCCSRK